MSLLFHNFTFILFSVYFYIFAILILIVSIFRRLRKQIYGFKNTYFFSKGVIIGKLQLYLLNKIFGIIQVIISINIIFKFS